MRLLNRTHAEALSVHDKVGINVFESFVNVKEYNVCCGLINISISIVTRPPSIHYENTAKILDSQLIETRIISHIVCYRYLEINL